jgi:hypothetical protein
MLSRTWILILILVVFAPRLSAQRSRDRVSLVFRGEAALQRQEIGAAIDAFRNAANDSSARRRAAAERMLAFIEWRFYRRFHSARGHLTRALVTGADSAVTLVEVARVAMAEGHYREGFALATRAHALASDDFALRDAILQMGHAVIEPALVQRIDGDTLRGREVPDRVDAGAAVSALLSLVRSTPGRTQEAHDLLLAALVVGDGVSALEAFHSYYLVDTGDDLRGPIPEASAALSKLLPAWRGDSASPGERSRLAAAFARARLFDAAGLVAPSSSELRAYAMYCRRLAREAEDYYRRALIGEESRNQLTRAYYRASRDLWPKLAWAGGEPPVYYPAAAGPELARRYGTVIQLGITGGFYDLHLGHVVGEKVRTVRQYGHEARLRFLLIDGIVSNGLQSWAWDGSGGHGGWQRRDTVIQVRPVFVEHTIALWLTADSARLDRERVSTAADSAADWTLAAEDSLGYLPGVAARLRRDGRNALLDSLRGAGLGGSALEAAFIRTVSHLSRESSIWAHEGRHAIDDALRPTLSTEEREFRAKLSEIAFADRPKLVMSSVFHANIGDATPHGQANRRIMGGLVRWMRRHASQIRGLDTSRPLLPQLPLLTDEQLRRAFRAMDPLISEKES